MSVFFAFPFSNSLEILEYNSSCFPHSEIRTDFSVSSSFVRCIIGSSSFSYSLIYINLIVLDGIISRFLMSFRFHCSHSALIG